VWLQVASGSTLSFSTAKATEENVKTIASARTVEINFLIIFILSSILIITANYLLAQLQLAHSCGA
jgi:hypothetical protein